MEDNITSKIFYKSWLKAVQSRNSELEKVWTNPKLFTKKITGWENSIVQDIANDINLLCFSDNYYSTDCVFYKKEDLVNPENLNRFHLKEIRIAFEHENNFDSGLFQEVSHLLLVNCDLRVLVSYPKSHLHSKNELNILHSLIKSTRQSKNISASNDFLIILNYEDSSLWEGLIFKNKGWEKIKEETQQITSAVIY
jgi:hypothetical protein